MIKDNCLGQLYAQFPGQNNWDIYYVFFVNSQLHFLSSIRTQTFRHCYVIHKVTSCKAQKYVSSRNEDGGADVRRIDVLLLTHQYDADALYVTHPLMFATKDRYPEYS